MRLGGDLRVGYTIGGTQNDPCARRLLLGHRGAAKPRLQLTLLLLREIDHISGTPHNTNVPELPYDCKALSEHCTRRDTRGLARAASELGRSSTGRSGARRR